jgi:hypothetical protein
MKYIPILALLFVVPAEGACSERVLDVGYEEFDCSHVDAAMLATTMNHCVNGMGGAFETTLEGAEAHARYCRRLAEVMWCEE